MIEYLTAPPPCIPAIKWTGTNFAEIQSFITQGTVTDNGDGTLTGTWFFPVTANVGDFVLDNATVRLAASAAGMQRMTTPGDRYVLETQTP